MRRIIIVFLFFLSTALMGQDLEYTKMHIDSLCSPRYHGRGYVENGDVKASEYLAERCREIGLKKVGKSYFQPFTLGVNSFPGTMELSINNRPLITGADYIIDPVSKGMDGTYKTVKIKPKLIADETKLDALIAKGKFEDRAVVIDLVAFPTLKDFVTTVHSNQLNAPVYLILTDKKLTWSVARRTVDCTIFQIQHSSLSRTPKKVEAKVDQEWLSEYTTQNVIGMIPGKSDSMIFYTAHYDHLGRMGANTFIAGASDNASGSAMLLDIARASFREQPEYTTVFVWFAGEEAGLVGSRYFVDHPTLDLHKIKFVMNLDLMADASKGITVVNGKVFTAQYDRLTGLNKQYKFLEDIKARGAASNSDHFPFYEKGIPSFFIYTRGEYEHYHDIYDVPENLPMAKYNDLYKLITEFMKGPF